MLFSCSTEKENKSPEILIIVVDDLGYSSILTSNTVTIAEVLKGAGYRSFGAGKRHINMPGPTYRDFEKFYGILQDH